MTKRKKKAIFVVHSVLRISCVPNQSLNRREGMLVSNQNDDCSNDFNSGELDKAQEYFLQRNQLA